MLYKKLMISALLFNLETSMVVAMDPTASRGHLARSTDKSHVFTELELSDHRVTQFRPAPERSVGMRVVDGNDLQETPENTIDCDMQQCVKFGCGGLLGAGILATIITTSILYQPYHTHITNNAGSTIKLEYYNGCNRKDSKGVSHATSCYMILYDGDRRTISSLGHLSSLAAFKYPFGWSASHPTAKALATCNDFKVTQRKGNSDKLTFTRLCKEIEQPTTNVTEGLYNGTHLTTNMPEYVDFSEQSGRYLRGAE